MTYGESNGHMTMTSRDSERSNYWSDLNTLRAQYLANNWRCYL